MKISSAWIFLHLWTHVCAPAPCRVQYTTLQKCDVTVYFLAPEIILSVFQRRIPNDRNTEMLCCIFSDALTPWASDSAAAVLHSIKSNNFSKKLSCAHIPCNSIAKLFVWALGLWKKSQCSLLYIENIMLVSNLTFERVDVRMLDFCRTQYARARIWTYLLERKL